MLVFIEQRHIDAAQGMPKSHLARGASCPLALALNEQTGLRVYVQNQAVSLDDASGSDLYRLSGRAMTFVAAADQERVWGPVMRSRLNPCIVEVYQQPAHTEVIARPDKP